MIGSTILKLFLLLTVHYAQNNPGSRHIALANADLASNNYVFSLFSNPSGTAEIENAEMGIFYSPAPFGLNELSNAYLAFCLPTSLGNMAAGLSYYGFDLYRETNMLLGYSLNMNDKFNFGISILFHSVNIKRYGSDYQFNVSLGGIIKFRENLHLGFVLQNPIRYSNSPIQLPLKFGLGILYKFRGICSFNLAMIKEIDFPLSPRFGIEYLLFEFLKIQFGIRNEPEVYSGGLTITYRFMDIGYSVSSHNILGMTHQGDIIIKF